MNRINFSTLVGIDTSPASHAEKIISGIGGFIAIFAIYAISTMLLGSDAFVLVASMGAATVLLFAAPHGPLSQPWPLIGGNLISAVIGVSAALLIDDQLVAAAAAVGLSITAMYYLKCIHPPGGATALSAVIGGSAVEALGFQYVAAPVLLNVIIIFSVALLVNYPFARRRYPAALSSTTRVHSSHRHHLSHRGIEYALRQIDSFIDVSEEDLKRIYELAGRYDAEQRQKR